MEQPVCVWPVGAELGEGPIWHGASNSVYFVDIRGRQVHRCAPDGSQRQSWNAPGRPGFIVPATDAPQSVVPAATTVVPAATTVVPAATTVVPAATTVVPAATTVAPDATTVVPDATTVVPAQAGTQVRSDATGGSENLGSRLRGNDGAYGSGLNDIFVVPAPRRHAAGTQVRTGSAGFIVGLDDGLYHFNEQIGAFSPLRHVEADLPGNRFNDGFAAADGSLWFGSMDAGETEPTGSLYSLQPDGRLTTVDSGYIITNGPAMSPDGKTLYHTDTLAKKIYAFDVLPDGTATRKRLFIATVALGHPDGMAVDSEGSIWVAMFRGARIDRYNPAGELTGTIAFPVSNITKLAFGGPDLRTAFVTTAWKGLSEDERAREPLAGALFAFRTDTPGLAQHTISLQDIA